MGRGLSEALRGSKETKADDKCPGTLQESSARDGSFLQGSVRLSRPLGSPLDGSNHSQVTTAAAEYRVQSFLDVLVARVGVPVQQHLGIHNYAVHAIAALCRLFFDEGCLQRVRIGNAAQPFQCRYVLILDDADRSDTGKDGVPLHDHRARSALAQTTTESRAS